jgi:hypothetical protein
MSDAELAQSLERSIAALERTLANATDPRGIEILKKDLKRKRKELAAVLARLAVQPPPPVSLIAPPSDPDVIKKMFDTFKPSADNPGCVVATLDEYIKFLKALNYTFSKAVLDQYFRGCVGAAFLNQQCAEPPAGAKTMPEEVERTKCFLKARKKLADDFKCPGGTTKVRYNKAGYWRDGAPPDEMNDHSVPGNSVIGKNNTGVYNYCTEIAPGIWIFMNHCQIDAGTGECSGHPELGKDIPGDPQVVQLCKAPCGEEPDYPKAIYCVTCKQCD